MVEYDIPTGQAKWKLKCYSMVLGDGELSSECAHGDKAKFKLESKGTGFSDMAPETFGALGTMVGNAAASFTGHGAAANAGAAIVKTGAEALKDRREDEISPDTTPTPGEGVTVPELSDSSDELSFNDLTPEGHYAPYIYEPVVTVVAAPTHVEGAEEYQLISRIE